MSNIKVVDFEKVDRANGVVELENSIVDAINEASRAGIPKTDIIAVLYVQLQAVTQKIIIDAKG